jgi:hypothetical protein
MVSAVGNSRDTASWRKRWSWSSRCVREGVRRKTASGVPDHGTMWLSSGRWDMSSLDDYSSVIIRYKN